MIIFLSYLFYFLASSISPLQRRWLALQRDKSEKEQVHFSFNIMFLLVLGSLAFPFFSPFYLSGGAGHLLILSLICGSFGAVFWIAGYIAQRHVDAAVSSVVSNISTPIAIILSTFLLSEGLRGVQVVGTILLLAALVIISKKHRTGTFRFDKYFLMMLLSGIALGILIVAERALQKTTGFSAGTMISWWSQCLFLGLATLFTRSRHTYTKKEIAVTGVLRFLQALSYVMLVWFVGNLSVVSAITTFKIVIIFVASVIFLREKEDIPRKIFGSIIALIGLLLMR